MNILYKEQLQTLTNIKNYVQYKRLYALEIILTVIRTFKHNLSLRELTMIFATALNVCSTLFK